MSVMQPLRRRTRRTKAEMNVVPYIDVMLVLLVIFMVVAPMIQTSVMNLPSVGASNAPLQAPLIVQMNDKTQLSATIAGQAQTFTNANDMVKAVGSAVSQKSQPVVLAADKSVAYGDVMSVMDALKQAHIEKVGLLLADTPKK